MPAQIDEENALTRSIPIAEKSAIKTTVEDSALVERRRAQLTKAAIACFSERGYHPTTIRDVAERADVSIGLIYQYVGDKEDLLFMALQEVLDSYMRRIPAALDGIADPLQRFCVAVRAYSRVNGRRLMRPSWPIAKPNHCVRIGGTRSCRWRSIPTS